MENSLKNIFAVSDLRNRVLFTLGMLGVYRVGHHIPVPGVNTAALAELAPLILRLQRELFVVGAELATTPVAWDRLEDGRTRVSGAMVQGLTDLVVDVEKRIEMPKELAAAT